MLHGYPTKNGTGISIYGDYGDLKSLYETVHQIASRLSEEDNYQKGSHQILMNFAYEIRKAYSGQRLKEDIQFLGDEAKLPHYGLRLVWPEVLIYTNALRDNAGFGRSNRQNQANLYLLEDVVEKALFAYDPLGANAIKNFIGERINVSNEYAFIIYQALHIKFVSMKPGKTRFRKIPQLLTDYFSEWRPAYNELMATLQKHAIEQNCEITDLEYTDFPDFKW